MKIVSMNCPHCGGTVKITADQNSCICPYCDSALTIDDGKFHIVDEAKIMEIELEKQKYQHELLKEEGRKERREAWRKKCRQWVLIEIVLFLIACIVRFALGAYSSNVLLYIGLISLGGCFLGIVAGPIYLAITRPDADYEKNNPPLIKNKLLFCIALMFAGIFVTEFAFLFVAEM